MKKTGNFGYVNFDDESLYGSLETTIRKGIEQTWEYMDKCGTSEGYLLIINRSPKKSWKDKIFKREKTFKGFTIYVYGM